MKPIKAIKSIEEENREDAVALLNEAISASYDSVIILGFRHKSHEFSIKSSRVHNRLELLGAMQEAEHHLVNSGVKG